MKLHGRGLPNGDLTHCIFYRTPGSLPSIFLSQLLSLCKNIMTSANRRNNYLPLPPGGQPGRLPRHSIFIFTSSTFHSTSIGPPFLSNPPVSLSTINSIFISSPNRVHRVINRSKIANITYIYHRSLVRLGSLGYKKRRRRNTVSHHDKVTLKH